MHISAISRFSPIVLTTLKKHASLSTARSIEKPIPIVDESQISVYRSLRDQVNFVSSLPAPTAPIVFPNGFAIMPTAASGGGDIRCAMDFALNLSQMGVVGIKVIILEGPNRGENDHIINSVLRSPKYENIPVFRAADLPADFVVPDVILAGPGANKDTEGRIGRLFANYSPQPSYHYLQMEEPGFISGAYKFAKGSEKKIGLGIYDFEWGLPVQAGLGRPIASLVDQNPARLLDLNNHWLRDQLLKGQAPEGYASNSLTALIYHHIDYVFARSVYMLASALKDNEKHIDIVAKV
ncbi:hypothetical protein EB093_08215, partial [bacterium]|nr:hypothetical protein [bacterium]